MMMMVVVSVLLLFFFFLFLEIKTWKIGSFSIVDSERNLDSKGLFIRGIDATLLVDDFIIFLA